MTQLYRIDVSNYFYLYYSFSIMRDALIDRQPVKYTHSVFHTCEFTRMDKKVYLT